MMKKITIVLGAIVSLILITVAAVYFKGTEVLMDAGKSTSSEVVSADLEIDDISLNPFSGVIGVKGFAIGQPEGFGDDESFAIDNFMIDVKPLSLFDKHIKVETILLDAPTLNLVLIGDDSNFGVMQERLDQALGEEKQESDIKISVNDFYINNTTLKIRSEQFGSHEVTLADIHLVNIGVDENGVAPSEVLRHAMDAIKPQVGKLLLELGIRNQLSNAFDQEIGDELKDRLENLPDPLKDVLDRFKPNSGD